jgi:hypothetical protein
LSTNRVFEYGTHQLLVVDLADLIAEMRNQGSWKVSVWTVLQVLVLILLGCFRIPHVVYSEDTAPLEALQHLLEQEEVEVEELAASTSTTSGDNNSNNDMNQQQHHDDMHCPWGTPCHPEFDNDETTASATETATATKSADTSTSSTGSSSSSSNNSNNNSNNTPGTSGNIPFVHHHVVHVHGTQGTTIHPPEGFTLAARVYTDPHDKLAHFTDDLPTTHITLPYWECGATGSTTSPLPVKHAYFRHALSGSKPQIWSGSEYGPHPQLIVALKRMEIILNSGETKQLTAGQVVLLEDVVQGGHKLKALEADFDMTYLVLTLPQHYHHVGRDRMALKQGTMEKMYSPCATDDEQQTQQQQQGQPGGAFVHRQAPPQSTTSSSWDTILTGRTSIPDGQVAPLREQEGRLRKVLLGAVGVSLSSLMADFLAKVAPLWLAVGIGGTCFVAGGTYGIVACGEHLWTEWEMAQEKKRLALPTDHHHHDDADDDEEGNDVLTPETMAAKAAATTVSA